MWRLGYRNLRILNCIHSNMPGVIIYGTPLCSTKVKQTDEGDKGVCTYAMYLCYVVSMCYVRMLYYIPVSGYSVFAAESDDRTASNNKVWYNVSGKHIRRNILSCTVIPGLIQFRQFEVSRFTIYFLCDFRKQTLYSWICGIILTSECTTVQFCINTRTNMFVLSNVEHYNT